jgi:hypothetical protein
LLQYISHPDEKNIEKIDCSQGFILPNLNYEYYFGTNIIFSAVKQSAIVFVASKETFADFAEIQKEREKLAGLTISFCEMLTKITEKSISKEKSSLFQKIFSCANSILTSFFNDDDFAFPLPFPLASRFEEAKHDLLEVFSNPRM